MDLYQLEQCNEQFHTCETKDSIGKDTIQGGWWIAVSLDKTRWHYGGSFGSFIPGFFATVIRFSMSSCMYWASVSTIVGKWRCWHNLFLNNPMHLSNKFTSSVRPWEVLITSINGCNSICDKKNQLFIQISQPQSSVAFKLTQTLFFQSSYVI